MYFAEERAYVIQYVAWKLWPVWVSIVVLCTWCLILQVYVRFLGKSAASLSSVNNMVSQVNGNFVALKRDRETMRARILAMEATVQDMAQQQVPIRLLEEAQQQVPTEPSGPRYALRPRRRSA
jgi:hypothetical protein